MFYWSILTNVCICFVVYAYDIVEASDESVVRTELSVWVLLITIAVAILFLLVLLATLPAALYGCKTEFISAVLWLPNNLDPNLDDHKMSVRRSHTCFDIIRPTASMNIMSQSHSHQDLLRPPTRCLRCFYVFCIIYFVYTHIMRQSLLLYVCLCSCCWIDVYGEFTTYNNSREKSIAFLIFCKLYIGVFTLKISLWIF